LRFDARTHGDLTLYDEFSEVNAVLVVSAVAANFSERSQGRARVACCVGSVEDCQGTGSQCPRLRDQVVSVGQVGGLTGAHHRCGEVRIGMASHCSLGDAEARCYATVSRAADDRHV
jgi:hypothetical protein